MHKTALNMNFTKFQPILLHKISTMSPGNTSSTDNLLTNSVCFLCSPGWNSCWIQMSFLLLTWNELLRIFMVKKNQPNLEVSLSVIVFAMLNISQTSSSFFWAATTQSNDLSIKHRGQHTGKSIYPYLDILDNQAY